MLCSFLGMFYERWNDLFTNIPTKLDGEIGIISNLLNLQYCPLAKEFMFNLVPNAVFFLRHTNKLAWYCYTVEVLTKNKQSLSQQYARRLHVSSSWNKSHPTIGKIDNSINFFIIVVDWIYKFTMNKKPHLCGAFIIYVPRNRFERLTHSLEGCCSIQLSYRGKSYFKLIRFNSLL